MGRKKSDPWTESRGLVGEFKTWQFQASSVRRAGVRSVDGAPEAPVTQR